MKVSLAGDAAAPQGMTVALLDVAEVFQQNRRFSEALAALKRDAQKLDAQLRTARDKLAEEKVRRRQTTATSSEVAGVLPFRKLARRKQQDKAARRLIELQARQQAARHQLAHRESRIYYLAYRDMTAKVDAYCRARRLDMVLRYDSRAVDVHDPAAVREALGRSVIYHAGLDITTQVVAALNASTAKPYGQGLRPETLMAPIGFLMTVPEVALKQVATSRAVWAIDQAIFPPAS